MTGNDSSAPVMDIEDLPEEKEDTASMADRKDSIFVRMAKVTARNPWWIMFASFSIATTLSLVGLIAGNFSISVENEGWLSRKTVIANREMQYYMIKAYRNALFADTDGELWNRLQSEKLQGGWPFGRSDPERREQYQRRELSSYKNCSLPWYLDDRTKRELICIWKPKSGKSALDPQALLQLCSSESNILGMIETQGSCASDCTEDDNSCEPAHSLVLLLRHYLRPFTNGDSNLMTCGDLIDFYSNSTIQLMFQEDLVKCADDTKIHLGISSGEYHNFTTCVPSFLPENVDSSFGATNPIVAYTSTQFPTDRSKIDDLYDIVDNFDKGKDSVISAACDVKDREFSERAVEKLLQGDMGIAAVSIIIAIIAMILHTRSIWLTCMGILQILFSFPLAYFTYHFILRLEFFPFLNFIGCFVVIALGADDVFVAVDKWKNTRLTYKDATTEEIAAIALPNAAAAMATTTLTTVGAFFATTICPIAPIFCFAIFNGLLILFDYMMDIAIVFPALCIYDRWLQEGRTSWLIQFSWKKEKKKEEDSDNEGNNTDDINTDVLQEGKAQEKADVCITEDTTAVVQDGIIQANGNSLIHSILSGHYKFIHHMRWLLLVAFTAFTAFCIYVGSTFQLPTTADVRLLPKSNEFEQYYLRSKELQSHGITEAEGSPFNVIWGIRPGDNGFGNNPDSLSSLFLDKNFEPKSTEAQIYLRDFCDRLFVNDFVMRPTIDNGCPINRFNSWLKEQHSSATPSNEYIANCARAQEIPVLEGVFHKCLIAWSQLTHNTDILQNNGKVQTISFEARSYARFDGPYSLLRREYNKIEGWFDKERDSAPKQVNKMFHTSETFWFYDTNAAMLRTSLGSAAIALGFSTLVVLVVSRSPMLALFSTLSICYVLAATTASLVWLDWSLGFLESICFAILVGISCDFIIHMSHAYTYLEGTASREERTKYALLHMGPSILAAAFTTIAASLVMFLCKIIFFQKFALILFQTMLHATIATFLVYIVFTDLFGPSEPKKIVNGVLSKCKSRCRKS